MLWGNHIIWQQPWWLLGLGLPFLLLGLRWWRSHGALARICDAPLRQTMVVSTWRWSQLPWRWLGLWCLLVVALAQPQWLSRQMSAQHQPIQWIAVVDVSTSMSDTDVAPSRLQQVRWALESLAQHWQVGDRAGLMVFSGSHHWLVPLTSDRQLWLSNVSLLAVDMLPLQGSLLEDSVQDASQQIPHSAAILVFTDGADMGEKIPDRTVLPQTGLLAAIAGQSERWPLPEARLQQLAGQWGMDYLHVQSSQLSQVVDWLDAWRYTQPLDAQAVKFGISLQPILLLLALLLWMSFARFPQSIHRSLISLVGLMLCVISYGMQPAIVWAKDQPADFMFYYKQAQTAWQEQRYDWVVQLSMQAFNVSMQPLEQAEALTLLADAFSAQKRWEEAAQSLKGSLAHQPNQPDTEKKLTFVLSQLSNESRSTALAEGAFDGEQAPWDKDELTWETKDVLVEHSSTTMPLKQLPSTSNTQAQAVSQAIQMQALVRQNWSMSGEMRQHQQDKRLFYQRLFSLEAGFAAVQDHPQPIDGVSPW